MKLYITAFQQLMEIQTSCKKKTLVGFRHNYNHRHNYQLNTCHTTGTHINSYHSATAAVRCARIGRWNTLRLVPLILIINSQAVWQVSVISTQTQQLFKAIWDHGTSWREYELTWVRLDISSAMCIPANPTDSGGRLPISWPIHLPIL